MRPGPRVAIVGGGASGTLTAIHLLRESRGRALEIVLLDAAGSFGPGVAYGTEDPLHLLNVPAARMGAIADRPEHFHRWLEASGRRFGAGDFVPRSLYGEYLRAQLEGAARAAPGARLERRVAEVRTLSARTDPGAPVTLGLDTGGELTADHAVLAVGPPAGRDPVPVPAALRSSGAYVADPWRPGALDVAPTTKSALLLGTGLTMVDVALSLAARRPDLRILAVSRNGLLPRRHRPEPTRVVDFPLPSGAVTLEKVTMALLAETASAGRAGGDWRDAIDSLRPRVPELWRSLPIAEKRRFLADLRRLWDIHRFRLAPAGADRLEELCRTDRLRIGARGVLGLEPHGDGVRAWLDGGGSGPDPADVDLVVNCTGAGSDVERDAPAVVAGMLADGTARPDPLGLGLDADRDGAVLDAQGLSRRPVHVVGALRKGVEWEAISVTEIRDQAARVARAIAAAPGAGPGR